MEDASHANVSQMTEFHIIKRTRWENIHTTQHLNGHSTKRNATECHAFIINYIRKMGDKTVYHSIILIEF